MFFRSVRFSSALLVTALLSACASALVAQRYVPPPAGSSFVMQNRDTGSFGSGPSETTTNVARRDWSGDTVTSFDTSQSSLLVLPNGGFTALVAPDGKAIQSWEPPIVWDFPLAVGKSWTKQYKLTFHAQNRTVPVETRQSVEAYEDVTTPAGNYKAFRVRTSDTLGNENVQWFSPEHGFFIKGNLRRTDKAPQGSGTRDFEVKAINLKRPSY